MKTISKLSFILVFILSLVGCNNKKVVNTFIYYKVDENCIRMGYIHGEKRQAPLVGDYTEEVCAIPNKGYVFLMWDDGKLEPNRIDQANEDVFVVYRAIFDIVND